jgi:hypothetical protein
MTDPRPRDNQGQFAPQGIDGIDANTTSTAYNPQVIEQRKLSLIEKIRRMRGVRNGVEESVPQQQLSARLRLRELSEKSERKGGAGRAALIGAGILAGGLVGARTLPRLLPKGRLAQEGESLLGKVVYNNQGVTTPLEVISVPGVGNLRAAVRRTGRSEGVRGKLARGVERVDQWAGVPQRHYGVGVGSGRISEVSKSRGRKIVPEESFGKIYVDDEGVVLREKNVPRRAEGRSGTMNESEVGAFNKRYEQMQGDPRWNRRNVCAAGSSNCEAYARGLATGKPVSRQITAMKLGAATGAVLGGTGAYAVTRKDMKKNQLSSRLRLRELARQTYDPYAPQPAQPGQGSQDFRNAAIGIGALGVGGGVAYAGWRGAQAAKSAQVLTDDALKTSAEARKAARSARVAAARMGRAGKAIKTQLTTFPTFRKAGGAIRKALRFEADLGRVKELAARSELTVDDISANYIEHPGRKRHMVGGVAGAAIGGLAGVGLAAKLKSVGAIRPLGGIGLLAGAVGGSMLADPHGSKERRRQMREAKHALRESWQTSAVPVESIKSDIPIASSYMGVARELKKQKVGFFKRHGAALATGGIRSGENAAFLPYGDKGVIVSPKRAPKIVIRHEQGHGKDYKIHGDFEKVYPRYGEDTWDSREYLQNTLLPEERAWRHARPRTKEEIKLKNATLGSYAAGGGFTRK